MKDERPTHLDLFSGIGGFALAAQWAGFRTIGFCEIDKYCQKVLAKNFMADPECERNGDKRCRETSSTKATVQGEMGKQRFRPDTRQCNSPRIFGNIFDLDGREFYGVSLITGGFPCQPFSVAGKRRGAADDRAIWPEMFRVINEARPSWVLGENVPGIIGMELDNVLSDLEGIGYATRSFVIPACAVDARHRRDRLWIIARDVSDSTNDGSNRNDSSGGNEGQQSTHNKQQRSGGPGRTPGLCETICDSAGQGFPNRGSSPLGESGGTFAKFERSNSDGECIWLPEPDMGRVAHGIPSRVDRLKGLGNAIVPQVAYEILREIRKLI